MSSFAIDFAQPIPLFPLPNCVLLPHATMPLHIFEPRYRRMTSAALTGERLIAMALFAGDEWKTDYEGRPPIRPMVCVGYIARHERLADGRYNLLLQGVCRAHVACEMPGEPFRKAMLEPTEERQLLEIDLSAEREALERWLHDPLLSTLSSVGAVRNWLADEIPTVALLDLAAMALCDDVEQRYALLAEADPHHRAQWLSQHLEQLQHTLSLAQHLETPIDHGSGPN